MQCGYSFSREKYLLGQSIRYLARGLIVLLRKFYNSLCGTPDPLHLSGNPSAAVATLVEFCDHVIVGQDGFFSFAEEGLLS